MGEATASPGYRAIHADRCGGMPEAALEIERDLLRREVGRETPRRSRRGRESSRAREASRDPSPRPGPFSREVREHRATRSTQQAAAMRPGRPSGHAAWTLTRAAKAGNPWIAEREIRKTTPPRAAVTVPPATSPGAGRAVRGSEAGPSQDARRRAEALQRRELERGRRRRPDAQGAGAGVGASAGVGTSAPTQPEGRPGRAGPSPAAERVRKLREANARLRAQRLGRGAREAEIAMPSTVHAPAPPGPSKPGGDCGSPARISGACASADASRMSVDGDGEEGRVERDVRDVLRRVAERSEQALAGLGGGERVARDAWGSGEGWDGVREDVRLRAQADVLEGALAEVEAGRVALVVREEEARLLEEVASRIRSEHARLLSELRSQVSTLLGERESEVQACRQFQRDLLAEVETIRGILQVLQVREQELVVAYEAAVSELQSEFESRLSTFKSEAEAQAAAEVHALREAAARGWARSGAAAGRGVVAVGAGLG